MKAFLLYALLLFAVQTNAQQFSIGARTGIASWGGHQYNGSETSRHPIWAKEVFGRCEAGRRLGFEIGFFEEDGHPYRSYPDFPSSQGIYYSEQWRFYGANLRAQFETSLRRHALRNFVGLVFAPSYKIIHREEVANLAGYPTLNFIDNGWGYQGGIEDMIQYRVHPHCTLHALFGIRSVEFNDDFKTLAFSTSGGILEVGATYNF